MNSAISIYIDCRVEKYQQFKLKIMSTKNLTDYYPVFKDLSDQINTSTADLKTQTCDSKSEELPVMLNAEELTDLSLKYRFTPFQTVILLLKNAFEGHVFLTWGLRPDELFEKGTLLFRSKPESMVPGFFSDFEKYKPGLNQIWSVLQEKVQGLGGINFDLMIHTILVNNLLRLPVSLVSHYDIRSFSDTLPVNKQAMDQHLDMVLLGENALGEHEFIQRVNSIYEEKYREFVHQLTIKEGVFSHYQRKLALALYPDIKTEEELDDLMYKKLIEEQIGKNSRYDILSGPENQIPADSSKPILRLVNKTKNLYRLISKNCSEIHTADDGEDSFPELNSVFMKANSIYNERVSDISEVLLQNMRMVLLLSNVVIFRKTNGLTLGENLQLISDFNSKEVMSTDDLKSARKNIDANLVSYRMKSYTDYKIKFVFDNDFTDIHNHFLQKQLDYIDQQIIQIQKDITEVLKLKSEVSVSKPGKINNGPNVTN
jgi:hypothetical protein